jgi:isopentenyl diphosphate isomerase/L-lactate dehydrogenase-like FMN-dependent dehydrogenase
VRHCVRRSWLVRFSVVRRSQFLSNRQLKVARRQHRDNPHAIDEQRRCRLHEELAPERDVGSDVRQRRRGEGFGRTVLTWDGIKRLKDAMSMKLLVKGIQTREDAELAMEHGVDGIIVSNHGGRAGASGRATIESLPEIAAGVNGRVPIILDSGVRRGTDIFKALALGATAVGIGRAYVWGLAAFGQEGVEAVLDMLRRELQMVMRQTGATSVGKITGTSLVDRFGGLSVPNR